MTRDLLLTASSLALLLAAAPAAHAEDAPARTAAAGEATVLEDIVVTAQRRAQSSQSVGASLSVVGGDQLDEKAISIVNDLENAVPNMEVDSQFGGGQPQFRIRGIGAREYSSNNASTVGIYVDEVAHPYTVTTQGALLDVARMEVLRGPQGTLYGRNTTGGAVNIITNAPTEDFRAGLSAEYGSYDGAKLEGYVSGPLAKGLRGRFAAITEQGGAWQYNRDTGEKLGDLDKTALRGRLSWDATDRITVDLTGEYVRDQSDGLGFRLLGPYNVLNGPVIPADTAWRITGWRISPQMAAIAGVSTDAKPFRDNEGSNFNARVKADLGWADLTSISAYETFRRKEYNDWDGTKYYESDVLFYNKITVRSQELRLNSKGDQRLNWMVGAHVADEQNDGGFYTQFRGVAQIINTGYHQSVEAQGVFTHNTFRLTDRLTLIGGLRYEHERRTLTSAGTYRMGDPVPALRTYETGMSQISGKIGAEYKLADDVLLYANISRGVKSGGFTTYNATSATPFKPEAVIAYETGVKSEFFNRRLRFNGALFYYDYKNQQVQGLEYSRDTGRLGKITNVPKSHIYGGEIEMAWTPLRGLNITQNLGYKTGKYDEYNAIDGAATDKANPPEGPWTVIVTNDRSGERLAFPRMNYGGAVSYEWGQLGYVWRAETNYNYRDELYSTSSSSIIPAYWLWNANLSMGPESGRWSVGLWGRNIFNQYYEETRNGFNGSARPTTSPHVGRTVGVRLKVTL
ncbi:TonB-dependent receptor [Caulobacter sp. CCUG 60055]|uniref:TonB-dependent receptor n=2 Tax=Pseudomonadota TaxID=1224 RepID=UPI001FA6D649|nr:TonB-dependent receptor [Caulobacter sp. CCUG 60055]MCI3178922.1 TonB-dependent receptor [Caulobacter sp. CCUG 60055]